MVDHIIVMAQGRISEEGTYDELISHEGAFAGFLKEFFRKEAESEVEDADNDVESRSIVDALHDVESKLIVESR